MTVPKCSFSHARTAPPPPPLSLCCFLLRIDLFTHSADMMAQCPSSHLYSHLTHGTERFTVNTSYQGQSILQSSILAYWTLSGIDQGPNQRLYYHRVPVHFWDRHPGSGPQFVVAEPGFPQRCKGTCHPMEKASWKPIQVWPNHQAKRRKHSIYR